MGSRTPASMLAVVMRSFGSPGVLRTERVVRPEPGPGEVLIRIGAVEVSTGDIAIRSGAHPYAQQLRLPHVLGGDAAGWSAQSVPVSTPH